MDGARPLPKPHVLLVEDNQEDIFMLRHAFQSQHIHWDLHVAEGSSAAIEHLSREPRLIPDLIITALLMRERSGHEVIAWARSQPHLKNVSIIAFSDTPNPGDRERALELGANHFVEKTSALKDALRHIRQFLDTLSQANPTAGPVPGSSRSPNNAA